MNFNAQNFKCRCSAIRKMLSNKQGFAPLTEKQEKDLIVLQEKENRTPKQSEELAKLLLKQEKSKEIVLGDTCVEYLMEWYAWETQKMKPLAEQFEIQAQRKGKLCEEEGITLLSIVEGRLHSKNEERISNDYLTGEPDVHDGHEVMAAEVITDIKNCFDYPVFLKKINNGLDEGNEEQVAGYCEISGAKRGQIAFTLCTMPEIMRLDFKKKLLYSGDYISEEDTRFLAKWAELEHSMIFDHIPPQQRVYRVPVERFSNDQREKIYDRVKKCREWLHKFHEKYSKLNQQ